MAEYQFNEPRFHDPEAARQHLESVRWPHGPVCPHCGAMRRASKLQGKSHRPGLYECGHCRDQFTVTVGTVFERSKISLDKWLLASALIASSKKGISAKQVERMLGVTYKTAWFMMHRLREAMKRVDPQPYLGGGSEGGSNIVEADETFVGVRPGRERRRGTHHKNPVLSLVERGGKVRSFAVANVTAATLKPIMQEHISPEATLMTDEAKPYSPIGPWFASHQTVHHASKEYVRGHVTTNTVEGYFSILKRGIVGTFHHVSVQHLQRYCHEFDFRYNHRETVAEVNGKKVKVGFNDAERMAVLLKGIEGKRLTYRRTNAAA